MMGQSRAAFLSIGLACVAFVTPAFSQVPANPAPASQPDDHSTAYYDFAMAHLYGELAGAYGKDRSAWVGTTVELYAEMTSLGKEGVRLRPLKPTADMNDAITF